MKQSRHCPILTLKLPQHSKSPNRKQLYLKLAVQLLCVRSNLGLIVFLTSLSPPPSLSKKNAFKIIRQSSGPGYGVIQREWVQTQKCSKNALRAIIWSKVHTEWYRVSECWCRSRTRVFLSFQSLKKLFLWLTGPRYKRVSSCRDKILSFKKCFCG